MPKPEWSFSLSEATVTLDDYARMKNVAFRAGSVPILFTPYLVWPTKEDRASGLLVPGIGYSNQRGGFLGLSYYWVTGRSTDLTTSSTPTSTAPSASAGGPLAAHRRVGRPLPGLHRARPRRHRVRSARAGPGSPSTASAPCPTARSEPTSFKTETRWKLRLDHVADDLPFGFRGVLSIRDYSDEQFLQDFERNFNLSSARQILSQGFLTRNIGTDSLNIRFERSETFYASTVIQERFPTIEFLHRTAPIGHEPVLPLARVLALDALRQPRVRASRAGTLRPLRRASRPVVSLEGDPVAHRDVQRRRPVHRLHEVDRPAADASCIDENKTRSYAEAGMSLVGPSFSRIYDLAIGPYESSST